MPKGVTKKLREASTTYTLLLFLAVTNAEGTNDMVVPYYSVCLDVQNKGGKCKGHACAQCCPLLPSEPLSCPQKQDHVSALSAVAIYSGRLSAGGRHDTGQLAPGKSEGGWVARWGEH